MFFFRDFLFLLIVTHSSTKFNGKTEHRIKRFFHGKSSKLQVDNRQLLKPPEANNNGDILISSNYIKKQAKNEKTTGYSRQDLAELKRILSKKHDDYYGILNIPKDATKEKIIIAHRKLALIVNPSKINKPVVIEARMRVNKACNVLMKKFEFQKHDNFPRATRAEVLIPFTLNNKNNDEISRIDKTSTTFSTLSLSKTSEDENEDSEVNRLNSRSYYFLLGFIVLIIGIVVFVIFWSKRQRRLKSISFQKPLKQEKIAATYTSPESDDGDTTSLSESTDITGI